MGKPKIGIVGLGSIGNRHFRNFESLGCPVVFYDPAVSPPRDWNSILECNAAVIASPTKVHFQQIMELGGARIPMLVEKPLVSTRDEWEKVPLSHVRMVGYNLRFHSCVRKVRQWLGDGLIGKPLWARFTCAQYSEKEAYLRDGVILNWSHEIDLALHLLGKATLQTASALRRNQFSEELADLILIHDNTGSQTLVHLDYVTQPERRGFVIVGERGSIDADLVSRQCFLKNRDGGLIHSHFGRDSFDSNYVTEAQSFLALIEDKVDPLHLVGCTGPEAHNVVDICLEAKEYIRGI